MRLNVYAEELVDRVEVVSKSPDNHPNESFKGVRMYLASPDVLHSDPDDDDSSAITIWVPWTKAGGHRPDVVTSLLRKMADALDEAYGPETVPDFGGGAEFTDEALAERDIDITQAHPFAGLGIEVRDQVVVGNSLAEDLGTALRALERFTDSVLRRADPGTLGWSPRTQRAIDDAYDLLARHSLS